MRCPYFTSSMSSQGELSQVSYFEWMASLGGILKYLKFSAFFTCDTGERWRPSERHAAVQFPGAQLWLHSVHSYVENLRLQVREATVATGLIPI